MSARLLAALAALAAAPPPLRGRPDDFVGAVGTFVMVAGVHPDRFRLDETAVLVVTLEGTGDLSNVRPPDLTKSRSFADRFDLVAPPKQTTEQRKVRFEYQIRARSTAVKAVPKLEASIYDDAPPRPHYRLLRTAEIQVEVLPAEEGQVVSLPPTPPSQSDDSLWRRYVSGVAVVGVLLLAVNLFLRGARRRPRPTITSRNASDAADRMDRRRRPPAAPAVFQREDGDQWFDRLGEALALPRGRRTTAEIADAAATLGVNPRTAELLRRNLVLLDAQRFGQKQETTNDAELQTALDEITEITTSRQQRSDAASGA